MPRTESTTVTEARAARPAARIQATSRPFIYAAAASTILAFAAAFLVSGFSIYWAGVTLLHLPALAAYALPVVVDSPMVAFALSGIARRGRGESSRMTTVSLVTFTLVSTGINSLHALSYGSHGLDLVGAVGLSAFTPVALLLTSEAALGVLVAPVNGSREQLAALQRVADRDAAAPATARGAVRAGTAEARDLEAAVRARFEASGRTMSQRQLAELEGTTIAVVKRALKDLAPASANPMLAPASTMPA